MDVPELVTLAKNVVTDDDDGTPKSQLPPKVDNGIILAQPTINPPPASISKIPVVTIDSDDLQPQRDRGTLANAPNA